MEFRWIEVPGGTCLYGDAGRPIDVPTLLWSAMTATYGQLDHPRPAGRSPAHPVTCVDRRMATAAAAELGGRLPRSVEWEWMAAGPPRRRWPWGDEAWRPVLANLHGPGHQGPLAVGRYPDGATPEGVLDVAGNVWEWTATPAAHDGAVIRGGSYASLPLYARCTFLNAAPAELRSQGIGFRVVREP